MGEPVGLLKVIVLQGKTLAIRDFTSSDPYVVVKIENQTLKTKVINSCLNPVWNEELSFTVTDPHGTLKLDEARLRVTLDKKKRQKISNLKEVFDKDRFKADDKMGNAQVSLQAISSAARLKRVLDMWEGVTNIRKVAPGRENCLARDSFVRCVNGEIVQDMWLRLCDVETGELELKLKWFDLPAAAAATDAITKISL